MMRPVSFLLSVPTTPLKSGASSSKSSAEKLRPKPCPAPPRPAARISSTARTVCLNDRGGYVCVDDDSAARVARKRLHCHSQHKFSFGDFSWNAGGSSSRGRLARIDTGTEYNARPNEVRGGPGYIRNV